MSKVWLITGSGNGLGRDIAVAALAAGDNVIAAARRIHELDDLVAQYGSHIHPVTLDVRDEPAAIAAVQAAIDTYGRLDVLVNNAGYGFMAPFEQMTPEQFNGVFDTCFWGVVYTTRAAIPIMRQQKSGHIFQVSSIGGRMAFPGNSPYHAAKWAVGGFSDSVGSEVAPFGVRITTLEPGGIRTNWAQRAGEGTPDLLPDYQPSVGMVLDLLARVRGNAEGDPKRIASVILDLAIRDDVPQRLILGVDAEARVQYAEAQRAEAATKWADVTHSTVFPNAPKIDFGLKP
jgi:NAD(P)-dependent dehydrogenase (short-subunit alcohol dehydrogenase family)